MLIWENALLLDFIGPFEVFKLASLFLEDKEEINIFVVAEDKTPVNAQGLSINPHYSIEDAPELDIVLIPGGNIMKTVEKDVLVQWLADRAPRAKHLLSVCTGVFMLSKLGLLDGIVVTTHCNFIDRLKESAPKAIIDDTKRFHDNGKIITSAGISAGIDMSLHVVQKLWGEELAVKVANYMEYEWKKQ
jgi:transcriptional regulator GlxA family with amidase domain